MEDHFADLVASQPGNEGKRFATAKDAGFFELAIELANRSPSDPHTLICAARIFWGARPKFALAVGLTAFCSIANGWGYYVTCIDVLDAYAAVMAAAATVDVDDAVVNAGVSERTAGSGNGDDFVLKALSRQLAG